MKKMILPLAACIALAACFDVESIVQPVVSPATKAADAPVVAIQDVAEEPRGCSLSISFGSYAMGIDTAVAQKVEALLMAQTGVQSLTRYRAGKEGEYSLCAQTRTAPAGVELFRKIKPLIPAKPVGPIEMVLAGGRSFRSPTN